MTRPPWEADHELDAAGARARIEAAFPELQPREVRFFAEGWDFRMFEVDGTWLFRFPKRDGEATRLAREIAVLDVLQGRLPVEIPHFEFRIAGLAGYRKLEGQRMVGGTRAAPLFARSLAATAAALHAIPPDEIAHLKMPGESDEGGREQLHKDVEDGLSKAQPKLDPTLHARCDAALRAPIPADYAGPPRLVHNDLYPDHILLAEDGGIAAVIDWGDTDWGDPAGDLAVAVFWGGPALLHDCLPHYPHPVDDGFQARALHGGTCMAIGHLTYGARTGKDAYVRAGQDALDRIIPPPKR